MSWVGMYGFNNTYGIVVRREVAEQYDLDDVLGPRRGGRAAHLRRGVRLLRARGRLRARCARPTASAFGATMDIDIGLKYQALEQGQIDVMVVFTTDGQLSTADAVVLDDDLGFFPSYLCGNIVRNEVLEEHPELRDVLERLDGTITDTDMAEMNYQVEAEGAEPRRRGAGVPRQPRPAERVARETRNGHRHRIQGRLQGIRRPRGARRHEPQRGARRVRDHRGRVGRRQDHRAQDGERPRLARRGTRCS